MSNPFATGPAPATATAPAATQPAAPAPATPAPTAPAAPLPGPAADSFGGADPFSGPAPQRPRGPRLQEMFRRLLLIIPHGVEQVDRKKDDGTIVKQDRMTADVIVLDGGQIQYGGKPEKPPFTPHDKVADVPLRIEKMFISSVGLISQCRDALDARKLGKAGMVLGRLNVGEAKGDQSPPYLLDQPTDADKDIARRYLATVDPFTAATPAR